VASGPHAPLIPDPPRPDRFAAIRLAELRRRAPYLVYRSGAAIARGLRGQVGVAIAERAGIAAGRRSPGRRAMAERHQRRIRGRAATARDIDEAFASYGRYWLESFRLPSVSGPELEAAMCYEGIGNVELARAGGRGVIMAMPHLGAWDWGGAWMSATGFPLTVVVESLEPPELYEWFADWRRRIGMTVVALDRHAGSGIAATLHRGGVVGLLCDRDLTGDGIEVEFLGERTRLPAGPATLALRTGAPLLPCAVLFEGDHHRGIVLPPLATDRRAKLRADVHRVTQDLADALGTLIRRAPEQWHVFQPNWPSDLG